MSRKKLTIALFGGLLLVLTSQAGAQPLVFPLEGSQEVPAVTTDAMGSCTATVSGTQFDIGCTNNVQNITAAHIHNGPPGIIGPIVFFFDAGTTLGGLVTPASLAQQAMDFSGQITPISFQDFLDELNAGNLYVNVHSDANPIGEIRGQIPPPPSLFFAQFGNGTDAGTGLTITSDIVLINTASTVSQTTVFTEFLNADGDPSPVGFDPVTLDPLESTTLRTDGMGDLEIGSVSVTAIGGPVGGVIRMSIPGFGVAGVPGQTPLNRAIVPVRNEGDVRTAIAIRNTSDNAIDVEVTFRGGGMELTEQLSIPVGGREARFVDEIFGDLFGTEFSGTVEIDAGQDTFVALALEQGNGVFTTLPVVPVTVVDN